MSSHFIEPLNILSDAHHFLTIVCYFYRLNKLFLWMCMSVRACWPSEVGGPEQKSTLAKRRGLHRQLKLWSLSACLRPQLSGLSTSCGNCLYAAAVPNSTAQAVTETAKKKVPNSWGEIVERRRLRCRNAVARLGQRHGLVTRALFKHSDRVRGQTRRGLVRRWFLESFRLFFSRVCVCQCKCTKILCGWSSQRINS